MCFFTIAALWRNKVYITCNKMQKKRSRKWRKVVKNCYSTSAIIIIIHHHHNKCLVPGLQRTGSAWQYKSQYNINSELIAVFYALCTVANYLFIYLINLTIHIIYSTYCHKIGFRWIVVHMSWTGISDEERGRIHQNLIIGRDFANAGVFLEAKEQSLDLLEKAWICFLKQDFKNFFESVSRNSNFYWIINDDDDNNNNNNK